MRVSSLLQQKLDPARFRGMSPQMAALGTFIMELDPVTTPSIIGLCITGESLLAMLAGDIGYNVHIGSVNDFEANWNLLLDTADLTTAERATAENAKATHIVDHRGVPRIRFEVVQ
jgi:hypothetical protein